MSQEVIIECRGLTKIYRMGANEVYALRDVDLDVLQGEYLSVMGPSGSGKSTLFNMIGALDKPSRGSVTIGGISLKEQSSRRLAYVRNHHIGYIFQSFNLILSLTALRNVMLPLQFSGATHEQSERRATEVLTEVGLGDRLHHRPDELSGGQQQRVAIARGLAMNPSIMLADEPTANLDLHTGEDIINTLRRLCDDHGVTVITATHDHKMLDKSDRILWIKDGKRDRLLRRDELDIRVGRVEHAASVKKDEAGEGVVEVDSPLDGVFQLAKNLQVGTEVNELKVIGVIEADGEKHDIVAGCQGVVSEVCVADGDKVRRGAALLRVKTT